MDTIVDDSLVTERAGRIFGSVRTPGAAGYGAARAVHNGLDPDNLFHLNHNIAP